MSEGYPLDYSEHLQEVGHGLLNGTLDRAGAVSKLIRKGWDKEEASAAVAEVAEQVETTKKLLRDAARVLDDTPQGEVRAAARLEEAGFSGNDAKSLVDFFNQQRHQSQGRIRTVVLGLRQRQLSRPNAVRDLAQPGGMDETKAGLFVDILTDTAYYWSRERLILWAALLAGSVASFVVVALFLWHDLLGWLGVALGAFVTIPAVMFGFSLRSFRYWQLWTAVNDGTRLCPKNCSPMIMLSQGKGLQSTVLTCTEWGMAREEAWEIIRQRRLTNLRDHFWLIALGMLLSVVAAGVTLTTVWMDPQELLPIGLLGGAMIAAAGVFLWRGWRGWRRFARL
jgi:hypothetical protein